MQSLKHIHRIIKTIAGTPGRLDKISIIKSHADDPIFKRILWITYSDNIVFHIKSFPKFEKINRTAGGLAARNLDLFAVLKSIADKSGATQADKDLLCRAASADQETYEVVQMICKGDLCCGVSAKTINQAIPKLIVVIPYMRCSTFKDIGNIDFTGDVYAQCKANGTFAYLNVSTFQFTSRSGSKFLQMNHLVGKLKIQPKRLPFGNLYGLKYNLHEFTRRDVYLMGELRVFEKDGSIMDRQKGNGILTSCISGTADPEVVKRIFYTVWDCITIAEYEQGCSDIAYSTRSYHAHLYVDAVGNKNVLRFIENESVHSVEECRFFYKKMRAQGEEGAVIKNGSAGWKNTTSKDQIKMKSVIECDLKIVGFTPHLKNPNMLGALLLESSCGKLRCKCGSGFTQEERITFWKIRKQLLNKIATVEAEQVIENKTDKTKRSLYTSTFIEIRHDKSVADSLKTVLDIEQSSERSSRKRG